MAAKAASYGAEFGVAAPKTGAKAQVTTPACGSAATNRYKRARKGVAKKTALSE